MAPELFSLSKKRPHLKFAKNSNFYSLYDLISNLYTIKTNSKTKLKFPYFLFLFMLSFLRFLKNLKIKGIKTKQD